MKLRSIFWSVLHSFLGIPRKKHNYNIRMQKSSLDNYLKAEFVVSKDGPNIIRQVKPYIQEFKTFAKGRWLGRDIIEVLTREFGGHPKEYWLNAVEKGHVRINNEIVPFNYKFRNSDVFLHRTHRYAIVALPIAKLMVF